MTANFGRWTTTDGAKSIDYALGVMEEIRTYVAEGFRRITRGGVEVGGVLFGTRTADGIRILAMRPVPCTYARGPVYILTPTDQLALRRAVALPASDPALTGMTALGWFVSHTRTGIALSDADREIFETYFSREWQVTLVLRPGRMDSARAAFFVRTPDGAISSDDPQEFNIEPNAQAANGSVKTEYQIGPEPPRAVAVELHPVGRSRALSRIDRPSQDVIRYEPPRFLTEQHVPAGRNWRWLFVWALALLCGAFALRAYLISSDTEGIGLQMSERDGEMHVEWNHDAAAVKQARQARLEIIEGAKTRTVDLTPAQLGVGAFPFLRRAADVTTQMTLTDSSGAVTKEMARYIGQPLVTQTPAELTTARDERDRLAAENKRLQAALRAERARADDAERRVGTLDNLLRIERNRSEVLGGEKKTQQ